MMKLKCLLSIVLLLLAIKPELSGAHNDDPDVSSDEDQLDRDDYNKRVSENRVGLPDAPIADPMNIPDMRKSLGMATLNMKNVKAYGFSKFRVKHIDVDLEELKADVVIQLDDLNVMGKYTLSSFLSKAEGPFTVLLKNVTVSANASLEVRLDGKVSMERTKIDMKFSDMTTDFQNLGFLSAVFQSIMNSAPNLIFNFIKPFILKEAKTIIRHEVDTNIAKMLADV